MKLYLPKSTIRLTIGATALLLSHRFCFADPCPSNHPAPLQNEETLASQYQPYGTILHRYRFVPPGPPPPSGKYPTVLMLPADVFNLEYGDEGNPSEKVATYDLQQAGFLVFQVEHRLAPPGALDGQLYSVTSGRFPHQTDDIKRQILAALADSQCDGRIYLVGGSAGGSLALWVMLDSSTGFPSFGWNEAARTSIKGVVSLSGPADFCDRTNDGDIDPEDMQRFENSLDNYVGLPDATDCSEDPGHKLENASPTSLVPDATSSPPVLLYATDGDPVPNAQATAMEAALITEFGLTLEVTKYIMHYTDTDETKHAFKYWHAQNNAVTPEECVSDQVIAFLRRHP